MSAYPLPAGAVVISRAGDRKRREAATRLQKESEAQRRPIRAALDLLLGQDREERTRRDRLAAMEGERDAVAAELVALRVRMGELKGTALPQAEGRVAAARARLDALTSDLERAQAIVDAQAVVDGAAR